MMLRHRWEVFFITQRPATDGQTVQRQALLLAALTISQPGDSALLAAPPLQPRNGLAGGFSARGAALCLEQGSWQPGLSNDTGECSSLEFGMVGNRNRSCHLFRPLLHHDMTSALSDPRESMRFKNLAHVAAGQPLELTQPPHRPV